MSSVVRPPLPSPAPSAATFSRTSSEDSKLLGPEHDAKSSAIVPSTSDNTDVRYERNLGDSELSYYLPARADGVNDMYLHLGFRTSPERMRRARVRAVWAVLRTRHPLLASKVEMHAYDDVRFVHAPLSSAEEALSDADANLEYRAETKDELLESYLNGPRTLSNSRLSYLIISQTAAEASIPTPPGTPGGHVATESEKEPSTELLYDYDMMICATHFLGDGMALHTFANDFFTLLGGDLSHSDLTALLAEEIVQRWGPESKPSLPVGLEERLPYRDGQFFRAVSRMTFRSAQDRSIGGHSFPRRSGKSRHTIVPTVSFDAARTKSMLKKCKSHGVSISAAIFAICNIAWARMAQGKKEHPMMMYSALNLRPYFSQSAISDSYWFLAVGYFNVTLPALLPSTCTEEQTFWLRARSAKEQSSRAAKNPLIAAHTHEMARDRGVRARAWAKEDDEKEAGTWVPPPPKAAPAASPAPKSARPPSTALIGLSLLGNLDGMYKHATFPALQLHTLTTGSRQRPGGMLLFGYTFASKLWLSLGYDENGFDQEAVAQFWDNALKAVDEFLDS